MKTLVHFTQGAALMAFLFVSGCQKEVRNTSNSTAASKKPAAPAQAKACDPWRNVIGYTAMFREINAFAACDVVDCSGSSTTSVTTFYTLQNPATGSSFLFSSVQTITASDQNAVMNAALSLAVANEPSGFFVSAISYKASIIVGGSTTTWSGVDIDVTYRKCTGGGGGGS